MLGNILLGFECLRSNHFHFADEETQMNCGYDINNAPETEIEYFIPVLFITQPLWTDTWERLACNSRQLHIKPTSAACHRHQQDSSVCCSWGYAKFTEIKWKLKTCTYIKDELKIYLCFFFDSGENTLCQVLCKGLLIKVHNITHLTSLQLLLKVKPGVGAAADSRGLHFLCWDGSGVLSPCWPVRKRPMWSSFCWHRKARV